MRSFSTSALIVVAVCLSAMASADYDTSFENPTSLGLLDGQDGWTAFGNPDAVLVQGAEIASGSQAVSFDAGLAGGSTWMAQFVDWNPAVSGTLVDISFAMRVQSGVTDAPIFGIDLYDSASNRLFAFGRAASGDVVLADETGSMAVTGALADSAWHRYRVRLDFATTTCRTWFDGSLVGSTYHWNASALSDLSDVNLYLGDDGGTATNVAYFDDVSIQAVPEPASSLALATATVAFLARRRRN
ncbi:MAG: PEP-CTERM sorting domain-containing protein [Fimbriimonas sp.]